MRKDEVSSLQWMKNRCSFVGARLLPRLVARERGEKFVDGWITILWSKSASGIHHPCKKYLKNTYITASGRVDNYAVEGNFTVSRFNKEMNYALNDDDSAICFVG